MRKPRNKKEPMTMTVQTIRPEALELIADQAAGKITDEQLLEFADQLELTNDEMEVAQMEFDRSQEPSNGVTGNADDVEPEPEIDLELPREIAPETAEQQLARLTQEREEAKGSAKGALTRQIKQLEAQLETERQQAGVKPREVKYPEFELTAIQASSRVHMESEPADRRVYFANVDREPNEDGARVKRSWGVVADGELKGILSAVRTNGETRYRFRSDDAELNADLGDDKKVALQSIARRLNGVAYLGS
jgi:hypothetical protein